MQPFRSQSATAKLDVPSNHTNDLLEVSMALTKRIFRPHISITKAGVLMQNLQSVDYVQQHLTAHYNPTKREKQEKLMRTIDGLNKRYGHNTVKWAICGLNQKWSIRREHLSHAATTRLQEIPIVHT